MPSVEREITRFQDFLARKYSILQQQANATTESAAATTRNADTSAIVGKAQAGLDNTRALWLPKESAASIAKMGAETGLIGEQAKVVGPESRACPQHGRGDAAAGDAEHRALQH